MKEILPKQESSPKATKNVITGKTINSTEQQIHLMRLQQE
jgi:hypothetical protein